VVDLASRSTYTDLCLIGDPSEALDRLGHVFGGAGRIDEQASRGLSEVRRVFHASGDEWSKTNVAPHISCIRRPTPS
jgi:hypothetical protein